MKYYALKYRYLHMTSEKGNLGDNFQTFPVVNMLKELGIKADHIDFINRDDLAIEKPNLEKGIFIAQGWFGCMPGQNSLPINDKNIHPLYFGFHANEGSWHILAKNKAFIESLRKYKPIGCRDIGTREFVRSLGIDAFFSRCMTMTFKRRKVDPKQQKVFIIDAPKEIENHIPNNLKENAIRLSQEDYCTSGYSLSGKWPMSDEDVKFVDNVARDRIKRLIEEATLVITRRIHVAMPCAAMGIPVVFCCNNKYDSRMSVVKEILPIHGIEEYANIDWTINAPSIENIKKEIRLMFAYRLQVEENRIGIRTKRLSENDFLVAEKLLEHYCKVKEDCIVFKPKTFSKDDVLNTAFGKQVETVLKGCPLILFGAGSAGSHLYSILKYFGIKATCFCDNKIKNDNEQYCQDLPLITFNSLKDKYKESVILITTKNYVNEIKRQLLENGFAQDRILLGIPLIAKYIDFALPPDNSKLPQ